ncbi:MAG TPA: multidrug ABC transporter ATP-binding protein, partial [Propionibacteriaceae bacterium]|nr:multidrug ABC transporter ATP-binding protein [Propionibacteriaceae bacterium]
MHVVKSLPRLIVFISAYRGRAVLAIAFLVGVAGADLAIPRLTQRVIDQGIGRQDVHVIWTTALLMIAVAALSAVFSVGNTLLAVRVGQDISADMRSALVRKVQSLSFGNLDRIQTGKLLTRTTSDINMVQMIVMMSMRMLIRAPLWMLGSLIMLLLTDARLAVHLSPLLPVFALLVWIFAVKARPLFALVQDRLDQLNQVLQENLAGVRVVKAFARSEYENGRFDAANVDLMAQTIKVSQLLAVLMPTMTFVIDLGIVGIIWFGGNEYISATFSLGELIAFVNYLLMTMFPMLLLGSMIGPLSAADASAARILEVLDSTPEVQDRPGIRPLAAPVAGRVAFEHVTFSYNGDCREPVLEDINLVAEAGQTVAILGATGSGKSSLVHLIPRFYDVTLGRITLDGVDVRDLPLHQLRKHVGVALQEAVLFNLTIRDNIRYGRADVGDDEVIAVAKAAQAHDFIVALPAGYDTLVGQRGVT